MRSRRLALAGLSLAAALPVAGCGMGRRTPDFGSAPADGPAGAVQAAPAAPAPPVVVAVPETKVPAERGAAATVREHDPAGKSEAEPGAGREEHTGAGRAHRRAAAREATPPRAPAADRIPAAPSSPPAPVAASDVGASDLAGERDRRSDAEARAAVVRFHELLDARDAHACLMLTPRLLHESYGEGDDAGVRCADATRAISSEVSVVIAESTAHGRRAAVAVVSRMGDAEVAQTLRLVLVDGTWLIDSVERKPAH